MAKNENNYSYMTRRIRSTTYKIKVVFNHTGTETTEDKILRIIRNSADTGSKKYGTINTSQMSRQPGHGVIWHLRSESAVISL